MGLFDVFKNKSGRSQKTHTNLGQKYVTTHTKTKSSGVTTKTRSAKSSTGRRKKS